MFPCMKLWAPIAAAFCLVLPQLSVAQETPGEQSAGGHKYRTNLISANPFGMVLGWYNIEYERVVGHRNTVALSASHVEPGDNDTGTFINLNGRYYPNQALHGFFVGGRLGVTHIDSGSKSGTGYSLGFELAYSWLLGEEERLGLSLGGGLNRIFGGDLEEVFSGAERVVWPSIRINVGWAF